MRLFYQITTIIFYLMAARHLEAQDTVFKSDAPKATLIELYSSEGCSSCPPAEAWLSQLKTSPRLWHDLYPVAFHVDYWDGLGWPDRFARPAYTQRQRDYAASLGQDSVYTPEFVIDGHEWRGWFKGDRTPPPPPGTSGELSLTLKDQGKAAAVTYTPSANPSDSYRANIALLGLNITSDVQRGENQGSRLQHDFIVLDFVSKPMTPVTPGHF